MEREGLRADLPITIDKGIMSGVAVFRGTRVPVQTIFDYLADGYTLDEFLDNFPSVNHDDAVQVLEAAGRQLVGGVAPR